MGVNSAEELVTVLNALDVPRDKLAYYQSVNDNRNFAVLQLPQGDLLVELWYPHRGEEVRTHAGQVMPFPEPLTDQYVVCNRLLDAETNEHCEFDGRLTTDAEGRYRCPSCKATRYGEMDS